MRKSDLNTGELVGKGKKSIIITFGCQMNEHDSEVMEAMLEEMGYDKASGTDEADLIILNTCTVRKKPEDKVASLLGRLITLKEAKKDLIIAVAGCMTQQEDLAHYIKDRFQQVDLLIGTHALPRLPSLIALAMEQKGTLIDIGEDYCDREGLPVAHTSHYKAWVPIIYGCNNFCSYCIVPYVRGRERSRKISDIVAEVKILAARGVVEITLLGQNVNSYGHDLSKNIQFSDLLGELDRIEGLKRIRFMTSHPKDLSDRLITIVNESKIICEHFHLPVQSGSNKILAKMNRRYDREHYLSLVAKIKNNIKDVAITSDIIVGFPGEEDVDFLETVDLCEKARFDNAFTFLFSPREKTAAAAMPDQVSRAVMETRLKSLNEVQHRISKEMNEKLYNQVVEVLVEGPSKNNSSMQAGRTRTNKLVHFIAPAIEVGSLVQVRITKAKTWNLVGEIIGDE